ALYLTRGEAGIEKKTHKEAATIRTREAEAACKILGMRPRFLGQIDGATELTPRWYDKVAAAIKEEHPDILVTHWPVDTHRDHRVCSSLVLDAWYHLERKFDLYYGEVMTGIQSQNFCPTDYVDITPVIDQKHNACFVHKSQFIKEEYPQSHGAMEQFRGMELNCRYAEAFIRHFQKPQKNDYLRML
ncbi:MAG TPA: PIG-L family deacetylase, partial [Prolixibacteraceae bacterium]|nr:PIG-L family deacetylase [Prolixibacteraceae bacterium]